MSAEAIEEQLQRLRKSPLFSHSRRYPSFLEHVVRKTLDGKSQELKERVIGIEVFWPLVELRPECRPGSQNNGG